MDKKKPKNYFFGEREEQAVIKYITSESKSKKDKLYNEILEEPFRKINQSILRRYPIHIGNYEIEELEGDALIHLIDNMVKYRPFIIQRRPVNPAMDLDEYDDEDVEKVNRDLKWSNMSFEYRFFSKEDAMHIMNRLSEDDDLHDYRIFNSKAYSYCGTIIRNYYRDHSRDTYKEKKTNLPFDDYIEEVEKTFDYIGDDFDGEHQLERLILNVINEIKTIILTDPNIREKEIIVGEAIINILENWQVLFMEETPFGSYKNKITNKYQKNKVLLMLNEQTGMTTKEMRANMKIFKDVYKLEKIKLFNI